MATEAKILLTAEDKTAAAFDNAKRGVNQLASAAGSLQAQLLTLGAGSTLGGLVLMVKRANDAVDALNDIADATGASIENISGLQRVAKLTGHDFEVVGASLLKFNQQLTATLKPGSEAESIIKQLGLNAKELRDMDPAEALRQTAVAFQKLEADGDRARGLQILFGKSTRELGSYLKDLAEQGELVATVTTKQAEEAEKFNRELLKLKANSSDWAKELAVAVVPTLNFAVQEIKRAAEEGGRFSAIIAGWRALTTGSDMQKANADMVKLTDQLWDAENRLVEIRGKPMMGNRTMVLEGEIARLKEAIRITQNYRKVLEDEAAAKPPEPPKRKANFDPEAEAKRLKAAADAQRQAEKEAAERRKQDFEVVKLRNQLVEQGAKDEEKKIKDLAKIHEEWAKMLQAESDLIRKNRQDYLDGIDKQIFAASAMVDAAQWEYDTYGKTASEIAKMTLARLEADRLLTALTMDDLRAIDAQIAAQQELIGLYSKGELRDANEATAKKAADDWQKASDQISQSLTDSIMEGGKNGADYITDLFRTMVLRPIIQAAVNPVAGAVNSALGFGGSAGGMGGAGMASGLGMFGTAASATMQNGLISGFGANMGNIATLAEGGSFLGAAGAASPYVAAAAIAAQLADSLFGGGGGPKQQGGAEVASGLTSSYSALVQKLNLKGTARFGVDYATDPEGDAQTQYNAAAFVNDRQVYSRADRFGGVYENVGRSPEELAATTAEEISRAMLAAVTADDTLAPSLRAIIGSTDAYTSSLEAVNTALSRVTTAADLQERLYQLTASDADKLTRARTSERDAMDAALQPTLDLIYAQEDLNKATTEAAAAASKAADEHKGLQRQLWELQGNTAALREADLAGLIDDVSRSFQQQIWAMQDQEKAANDAAAAQEKYNNQLAEAQGFINSSALTIGQYLGRLAATPEGLGSPESNLVAAREQYQQQLALARGGDRTAISGITGYASQFIDASKAYSASGGATGQILAAIRGDLSGLPAQLRPEQLIVDAVDKTTAAVGTLKTDLIEKLGASFNQLDANLSSSLDLQEVLKGLGTFATEETLREVFNTLDADGDGQITRLEALGRTAASQLAAAEQSQRELEAIKFQQRQLDNIWQRMGGFLDLQSWTNSYLVQDAQRQDFHSQQFDAIWSRLGQLAGGGGGGADAISIRVVTASGSELTNTVIGNLRERSRYGEIVVYASGVGA